MSVEETHYEKELISYICQNTNGVGEIKGNYIAENFDSLQEFLNCNKQDLGQVKTRKGAYIQKKQIPDILKEIKKIPKKYGVRETWFYILSNEFLQDKIDYIANLCLDNIDVNPFLIKTLNFKNTEQTVTFLVYQNVSRSIVTTWGTTIEKMVQFAGGFERVSAKKGSRGSTPDIKKKIKRKDVFIQVKSGPNTMNVSMVQSLDEVIQKYKADGKKCILGMTYGKRNMISEVIKKNLTDYSNDTLIGRELWDYVANEKNYHKKILSMITVANKNSKKSFSSLLENAIKRISNEWDTKFAGKSIDKIAENFL